MKIKGRKRKWKCGFLRGTFTAAMPGGPGMAEKRVVTTKEQREHVTAQ